MTIYLCHGGACEQYPLLRGSACPGAHAVRVQCGYWGCSANPFIQSQSGGMVTPQSPPGTIFNSSPGRPSPGEIVQIPDTVRPQCTRRADTPPHHGPNVLHTTFLAIWFE